MDKIETLRQVYVIAREHFAFSFFVIIMALLGSLYVVRHRNRVIAFAVKVKSHLSYLAVKNEFRGMGYGKRLLENTVPNVRSLYVKTTQQNVISLYQYYGFSIRKKTLLPVGVRYFMVRTDS